MGGRDDLLKGWTVGEKAIYLEWGGSNADMQVARKRRIVLIERLHDEGIQNFCY